MVTPLDLVYLQTLILSSPSLSLSLRNSSHTACKTHTNLFPLVSRLGKMPPPSRLHSLQVQRTSLEDDLLQRRAPRRLLRLVPDFPRLRDARRGQIRLLRGIQTCLRRQAGARRLAQAGRLPCSQRLGRVPCRHSLVPHGSHQGAHADKPSTICAHAARGLGQGGARRRRGRPVQGLVSAVGAPDSLHHGQVCHV